MLELAPIFVYGMGGVERDSKRGRELYTKIIEGADKYDRYYVGLAKKALEKLDEAEAKAK